MPIPNWIIDIFNEFRSVIVKILGEIYKQLPFEIKWRKPVPKLGIIESSWRNHSWAYGTHRGEKVVVLDTHWQLTNTLPYNLTTFNAFLKKPEYTKGSIMLKDVNSQYWGHYPLPRGYTTEMGITFAIDKKHIKKSKDIIKAKIGLQDPTGRIHKIGSVLIYPQIVNKKQKAEQLKVEDPSKIDDETEKQVVAVLKNEVQQYKVRGRREGRLGTVDWPQGTLEYRQEGEKIQFLSDTSLKSNVTSEYEESLLKLYNQASNQDKEKIVKSLLNRIDKRSEYRDVGYLIVFCLFEMGHLKEALSAALKKLEGDKANGFGDVMRILDILLTFRYQEFNTADLKEVEDFVYSTKEHPFSIKERINAIKVKNIGS